jgi:DNA-binding LacI/PurR family transcriptional regulator
MADARHEHYRRLSERRLPVVLLNAGIDHLGFPRVSCDDAVAVEQGVAHLRSLGHERIGLVLGTSDHLPSRRKLDAFRALLGAADDVVEHTLFSIEGGQVAAGKLIDRGVTGILCASDLLALGSVRAARRRDRSVPGQVSIVGYDDSQLMTCAAPPLTTVRQPIEAMGRSAVELLVAQIEGTTVTVDELLFEPELVVRGSTGPASR